MLPKDSEHERAGFKLIPETVQDDYHEKAIIMRNISTHVIFAITLRIFEEKEAKDCKTKHYQID